ncbi:MAG: beta family protein [Rhodoferax sp.]|uniref:beta family protein n=1 Tax=Rhodoferax sp. TaxID=50421 RepID=UPI0026227DD0|nr:beta family protein [Rhodoferax sp.]MDD5335514.1 beta family protein [Rhodoferax sp.]
MAQDNYPLYMPALKWKQGEHFAVKPLTASQKSRVQPVAEVPDRTYDWGKEKYTKSWDKHIDDIVTATVKNWGTTHVLAVDQVIDEKDALSSNPGTPWEYLFDNMWAAGVKAVPVLSTRASASEQAALIKVAKKNKHTRWLLRFRVEQDGEVPATAHVQTWFANKMAALGVKHGQVDAVLDLGHITGDPKVMAASTAQVLQTIAALGAWRQVVLLSGGFPINLAGVQKGNKQLSRADWDLYKRVAVRAELKEVSLGYGDFGVSHVDAFDGDPRKMVMSAALRYTHWKDWNVLKAKSVRHHGFDQYKDLCQILVLLPIYMHRTFSQGDANYDKVANDPKVGPGNATQWRRDATSHHIHVVLHQLASQPEF